MYPLLWAKLSPATPVPPLLRIWTPSPVGALRLPIGVGFIGKMGRPPGYWMASPSSVSVVNSELGNPEFGDSGLANAPPAMMRLVPRTSAASDERDANVVVASCIFVPPSGNDAAVPEPRMGGTDAGGRG